MSRKLCNTTASFEGEAWAEWPSGAVYRGHRGSWALDVVFTGLPLPSPSLSRPGQVKGLQGGPLEVFREAHAHRLA